MLFNTTMSMINRFATEFQEKDIRETPMLYRATMQFASEQHSPIVNDFLRICMLDNQSHGFRYCSLDTRVSMLMPGWFPCIPGWHCDDFYRPDGHPAPSLAAEQCPMVHYMAVLGDCSLTEFLSTPVSLPSERVVVLVEGDFFQSPRASR